ncbi:hypothetical protein ACA910_004968 [Epithemia clementina (nom. ined.)]
MDPPPSKKSKQEHTTLATELAQDDHQKQIMIIPRPYRFPGKPIAKSSGNWQSALQVYLSSADNISKLSPSLQENIYYHDDNCVVIYDGYPKARMHLLLLPRRLVAAPDQRQQQNGNDSGVTGSGRSLRSIADLSKDLHYEELKKSHATARQIVQHLTKEYRSLYCNKNKNKSKDSNADAAFADTDNNCLLRMGYHAIPSLDNLHLHIISTDLDSPCLKNKKHYNSFTTSFFVEADQVEQELLQNGSFRPINEQAEEEKLKQPLCCFKCGEIQRNIPTLKQHLLVCSHPYIPFKT